MRAYNTEKRDSFSDICQGYITNEECNIIFSRDYEAIDDLFAE